MAVEGVHSESPGSVMIPHFLLEHPNLEVEYVDETNIINKMQVGPRLGCIYLVCGSTYKSYFFFITS